MGFLMKSKENILNIFIFLIIFLIIFSYLFPLWYSLFISDIFIFVNARIRRSRCFTPLREALSPAVSGAGKGIAEMHLVAG